MSHQKREPLFVFSALNRAIRSLCSFASLAPPGNLAMCIGPGGAGKTSVAKRIGGMVFGDESSWEPGTQPYVYLCANVSDRGYFSPKAFIASALKALQDPFRATSEDVATWNAPEDAKRLVIAALSGRSLRTPGERQLRDAFVSIARLRKVRLLIIDEANLLALTQVNRVPTDYLESIRLLGDEIGCPIILLGTTAMLHLLSYSAQINRRTLHVQLDRMRCDDDEGEDEWVAFLRHLTASNEVFNQETVLKMSSEIFLWTQGIPGEAVALLQRARHHMAGDGCVVVTRKHLEAASHLPDEQEQMIQEAELIDSAFGRTVPSKEAPRPKAEKKKKKSTRMLPHRRQAGFGCS